MSTEQDKVISTLEGPLYQHGNGNAVLNKYNPDAAVRKRTSKSVPIQGLPSISLTRTLANLEPKSAMTTPVGERARQVQKIDARDQLVLAGTQKAGVYEIDNSEPQVSPTSKTGLYNLKVRILRRITGQGPVWSDNDITRRTRQVLVEDNILAAVENGVMISQKGPTETETKKALIGRVVTLRDDKVAGITAEIRSQYPTIGTSGPFGRSVATVTGDGIEIFSGDGKPHVIGFDRLAYGTAIVRVAGDKKSRQNSFFTIFGGTPMGSVIITDELRGTEHVLVGVGNPDQLVSDIYDAVDAHLEARREIEDITNTY